MEASTTLSTNDDGNPPCLVNQCRFDLENQWTLLTALRLICLRTSRCSSDCLWR
jgi:hypothetical protein